MDVITTVDADQIFVSDKFPRLLHQKVTIPDRVPGYVHRNHLLERTTPTNLRLTVIRATAGFGKTTLLAECCRRLRQNGVATAWVSLDERDKLDVLDIYIAYACFRAGLNLSDIAISDDKILSP